MHCRDSLADSTKRSLSRAMHMASLVEVPRLWNSAMGDKERPESCRL